MTAPAAASCKQEGGHLVVWVGQAMLVGREEEAVPL